MKFLLDFHSSSNSHYMFQLLMFIIIGLTGNKYTREVLLFVTQNRTCKLLRLSNIFFFLFMFAHNVLNQNSLSESLQDISS